MQTRNIMEFLYFQAGANMIVSGTGIIKAPDQKHAITCMRNSVQSAIESEWK